VSLLVFHAPRLIDTIKRQSASALHNISRRHRAFRFVITIGKEGASCLSAAKRSQVGRTGFLMPSVKLSIQARHHSHRRGKLAIRAARQGGHMLIAHQASEIAGSIVRFLSHEAHGDDGCLRTSALANFPK
jgi:hypothetical protein